jgi:hypothetical protein
MKFIYIVGKCSGSYRSQNLLKILLDSGYSLFYGNMIKLSSKLLGRSFGVRIVRRIVIIVESVFSIPYKTYLIMMSDIVFVLAMNHYKYRFEIYVAKIFNKKIILDFYISSFDTMIIDRHLYPIKSNKAKKYYNVDRNVLRLSDIILFLNKTESIRYSEILNITLNKLNYRIVPLAIDSKPFGRLPYLNMENEIFRICWWGAYLPLHGLEKIIYACELLVHEKFNFEFYIFGTSYKKSLPYFDIIKKKKLEDRIFINNDYSFSNNLLTNFVKTNCDLVLGNFGDSEKAKNVIVNKVIDGISMKIPVLTGESNANANYFDNFSDIWNCDNTSESIKNSIFDISQCEKKEIEMRVENSYKIYQDNFSINNFKKNILDLLGEGK